MVSSTAATKCPKDNQDNKQTSLENEIQGILMKTVEATHIRRKYSSMISALTQEESDLEKVIKETEAEIQNRVNEMRTLRQVWAEAYQSEKQIRVEVKKCEQFLVTVKKDFEKRQHALRTKVSEIRTEGFLGDSDNSQGRSPGVASSCVSRYQPSMDSFQEKLRKYEEMNGQIKSQTGLEDIKELLSAVNELSEASDRLQNMELDLRHKISRLEAEKKKSESNASRPKLSRIANYKFPLTRSEYKDGDLQSANDVEQLNEVRAALRLLCVKLSAAFHQPSSPPSDDPADLATLCVEKLENLVDFCGEYNQDDVVKAMEGLQLRESIDDTMALLKFKRRSESPEPIEELPEDGAYNEVGDERDVLTRIMVKKLAKQATDFHAKRQQKDSMKRK